jgi:hypothetical protein
MELDITPFFNEAAAMDYSASVAEIGANAARETWAAALDSAEDYNLLDTPESLETFREYLKSFGAWDANEIATFTDIELNALCIQFIAGDMREANLSPDSTPDDWKRYEIDAADGRISGRIFKSKNDQIYFYIGN